MAKARQLKALLQAYIEGDNSHFYSVAMQLAADEAKKGHGQVAKELRTLIDKAKTSKKSEAKQPILISQPRGELEGLLSVVHSDLRLSDMVLTTSVRERLERLIKEQCKTSEIRAYGLSPRKKMLLLGMPGTGKTLTASVLAGELGIPLFVVRLDSLITKYMGETSAKLRLIFDSIEERRGVYLFDEFDSIGSQRGLSNDVGEMRRVLNSFLQLIEHDSSNSLLLAATNHVEILDHALFRRFDDVIEYELPLKEQIISTLKTKLAGFEKAKIQWSKLAETATGLSYGDITKSCEDAMKDAIIHDRKQVTTADILKPLKERKSIRQK